MVAASNAGRVGVWGASGSGKSAYVKRAIKQTRRLIVFDTEEEYDALCNINTPNLDKVRLGMMNNWDSFKIAYHPRLGSEPKSLSNLCHLLLRAQAPYKATGHGYELTLVVEEMNLSFPVSGGAQKCPGFAEICSRGRKYGINVIGVSQRIAEVSTRFRGNCTETVGFRQHDPIDQKAASRVLGCPVSEVVKLKKLEYLRMIDGDIERGKLTFSGKKQKK